MEKKILRVLIADDSPDDAEHTADALRKAGYMLRVHRVQDLAAMKGALDTGHWDVVLSELSLPNFGAQMALDLVRRTDRHLPFIVVTHGISDPDTFRIMRAGAHDVILKNQCIRLGPAIERELRVAQERAEYKQNNDSVKELEVKHQAFVQGSREAICYCHDGMHVDANRTYLALLGYGSIDELEGVPLLDLIQKSDHERFKEFLRQEIKEQSSNTPAEFIVARKNGSKFHAEISVSTLKIKGENCLQLIVTDISRRKAVESKLQYLNQRDPLTGLYNRHYFLQELGKAVEKARCGAEDFALLFFDVDQLKKINDSYGNAAGDRLLLKLARFFREKLDESAVLSRFGGDEFAILFAARNEEEVRGTADNLREALKSASFAEDGNKYECDCTMSVTIIDKQSGDVQKVLTAAQNSCDEAKSYKRPASIAPAPAETAAPATPAPAVVAESAETAGWGQRIQHALDNDGLQLVYQPIISLHGDGAGYYEALVRMQGADGELISAAEFMPAAEQSGQILLIDRWVIRNAVQTLAALHREEKYVHFFINVSANAFTDEELPAVIEQTLLDNGLQPEYVIFESDESAVVSHPADAGAFVRALKRIGCGFAMDNYGTGLGTYNHLRHQPIEFLKIDGALIHNLASDSINQAVLKAMVGIGKALDKKIIAKYVEDAESLSILWNLGVDYVQGNYLQEAAAQLNYDFSGETTLSSEETIPPGWLSNSYN